MAIEFRPVRADEMTQYTYMDHVGFGNSTAEEELTRSLERNPLRAEDTLVAFEDGEQIAHMAALPFNMRWNGRDIDCAGVVDVTTLPSHRRRGLVLQLMTRYFAQMKERGQPVAMLWASMAAIYQRFGYGIAYTMRSYDFDPRHLRLVDEIDTPGRIRMIKQTDAIPPLAAVYERFATPRTLMLRRDEKWWRDWVLRPWRLPPWLVAVYEENGEAQGYAIYTPEVKTPDQPGPYQQLQVVELAWNSPAAHRALLRLLAGYDLAYSVRFWRQPDDDPLLYQAQEPRLLHTNVRDGTLVRIVDAQRCLQERGYDGDGRLVLALQDELCPWNSGVYELSVEAGCATVKRSDAEPSLSCSMRALAILCSGRQSATELAHIGTLASTDTSVLRTADALFHTAYAPFCADGF